MRNSNSLKLRAGIVGVGLAMTLCLTMVPAAPAIASIGLASPGTTISTVTPAATDCKIASARGAAPCPNKSTKPAEASEPLPAWARWIAIVCLVSACIIVPVWVRRRIKLVEKEREVVKVNSTVSSGTIGQKSGDEAGTKPTVKFSDVVGQAKAKSACEDSVLWLKNGHILMALGAYAPVGIILAGPPGTGKTLLAKAVAGEAGVPFFETGGSDFAEKFVGVGAKRIRELFAKAKAQAPSIVFFDEIDSFAHPRGTSDGTGGAGEDHKIVNALLKEINDLRESGVLVMAATNFFDNIDAALVRPGRFEVRVNLSLPKVDDRQELFLHYLAKKKLATDVDLKVLAQKTAGMTGASIERICNESALALGRTLVPLVESCFEAETADAGVISLPASEKAKRTFAVPGLKRNKEAKVSAAEESIKTHKLRITEALIATSEGIKMNMMLAAINEEVHSQAKRSDGNRYQQLGDPITFDHLKGVPELVEELTEVRDLYLYPESFPGQLPPKGILLKGPPGGGKTLAARALADELGIPFFSCAAAAFDKMLVGSGADAVRKLFAEARACAPSALFIDEIDSVARKRDGSATSEVYTQTLTALLNELDGLDQHPDERVLFICATNQADKLDDALLRAGRVDLQIEVNRSDLGGREELFRFYMRDKDIADDVDLNFFAATSAGLSASAIRVICDESVSQQRRINKEAGLPASTPVVITPDAINIAITRQLMNGVQRKSRIMSVEDKFNIAVHEGGHAGVHHVVSDGDLIARITIMAWGDSGGHVQQLDKNDFMPQRQELINRICVCLGGRVAQQLVLNRTDVGASNDFQQARTMAYYMVTEYGMSPLGPRPALQGVQRSPKELAAIEEEVQKILSECEARVRSILIENRHRIDAIVEALMKKETILGPEFKEIWESATIDSVVDECAKGQGAAGVVIDIARRGIGFGASLRSAGLAAPLRVVGSDSPLRGIGLGSLRGRVAASLNAFRGADETQEECC